MKRWWALALVLNAACLRTTSFHCAHDSECGMGGACQSVGFCSFADPSCPDGQRFGELGGAYANECVGAGPGDDASSRHTIGGTTSGLTGTGLVLRDNNTDDLTISANGPFTFGMTVANGAAYRVAIVTAPSGQDAYIGRGNGNANADVTDIVVSCYPAGSDPGVLCDGVFCTSGQSCCTGGQQGRDQCQPSGQHCTNAALACDSGTDCGGNGVCCAHYHNGNNQLQDTSCAASPGQCAGANTEILCDPRDATPCQNGQNCTGTSQLGSGYHTCK